MKYFDWNKEKNEFLKKERNISFEEVVLAIQNGMLLDRVKHHNPGKYPKQFILYVQISDYVYAVPNIENENKIFLKTIYPDRRATKKYLGEKNG
jgi:uncharacterized DUF497 family protein